MGTPHRGLPPPSAMTLPDPGRGPPSMPTPLGSLPPAPSQWQGAEDGMKNWLAAKAEEERRRQEEERTRQETLKLEQRKIEQSMLRESMQGGVPPHLVPIIFAGIGGGNLANISAEWIQQYTATVQAAHQQAQVQSQSQISPDLRRDTRMIGQQASSVYAGQTPISQPVLPPTAILPGQPLPTQAQQAPPGYGGIMSPQARAAQPSGILGPPTSVPRSMPQSQLPRLTTNEMNIQQPPTASSSAQQSAQQEQSSPSIYFHHWVPPSSSNQEKSSSGNPPATPSEYTSSPKKRKAQGPHPPPPPPTSAPQSHTSPSFSHVSTSSASTPGRRGHARGRSDASIRAPEASSAPVSRRGTVSGLAQEAMMRQSDIPEDIRHSEAKLHQHLDRAYATSPRQVDSRGQSQHAYAPTSKPETPKYGSHQQWDRGYMSSPKRETGDR
ncbi:hypothetical protein CC86DRAFT_101067 [Ophiobolus disseminans]|uniref:Uncharacterized protein n=1 Tax=Ophiobolus disseminans TaxID=1469910 RepID=A0A6A6ZN71_9PLEO|nr:hypothetical protein CC86DRAFT_101067 [Ophiobolus disseminans]